MQLDHNYFRFPSAFWSVESRPGGNSVRWSLPGDSRPRIWVRIGVRIDNICCNPLKIEGRDPQSARSKYRLVRNSQLFWPWSGSVRNLYCIWSRFGSFGPLVQIDPSTLKSVATCPGWSEISESDRRFLHFCRFWSMNLWSTRICL